jgi:3D (Asp-Asp-Asp) domain-containing protein
MTGGLIALALLLTAHAPADNWCSTGRVTGYIRGTENRYTADGTDIWTDEPIAAAGYAIPMGSYVSVEGVGTFRVADRGLLGPTDVDVAVYTRAEAYALTRTATVCVGGVEQ